MKIKIDDYVQFQGSPIMPPLKFKVTEIMENEDNTEMVCGEYGCFPRESKALTKITKEEYEK